MSNKTKVVGLIGVIIVAVGAALLYAQPDNHPQERNGNEQGVVDVLDVSEKIHDFGSISMKNGNVNAIFKVKNSQSQSVVLNKLYTSCMCTQAKLKIAGAVEGPFGMLGHGFVRGFNQTLQPKEEAEIEVIFDPNAHGPAGVGLIEREVTLEGKQGILAVVKIKVNVTP